MKVANRIPSTTWDVTIGEGHHLKVSLAYDKDTGILREVVFVGRGKSGHGLDDMLSELGIKLSRIIQGRDPESGEDVVGTSPVGNVQRQDGVPSHEG